MSECEMRSKAGHSLQIEEFPNEDLTPKKSPLHRSHSLNYLRFVPDLILSVGLFLAWYVRWEHYSHQTFLLSLGVCGVCLLVGHVGVYHYCRSTWVGPLVSMWFGCMIGVVTLFDTSSNLAHYHQNIEDIANSLLVLSVLGLLLVELTLRCCLRRMSSANVPESWCRCQFMHLVGVCVACVLHGSEASLPLILLTLSFFLVLYAMRLGSFMSVLNAVFLIVSAELYLCPDLNLGVNPYGMICLVGRLAVTPLIDLLLGGDCKLEKWKSIILMRRMMHLLLILFVITIQVTFFVVHASAVSRHKEWYVVVPFFVVCSCVWILVHIILVVICTNVSTRFTNCKQHISLQDSSLLALKNVLAARGLRYFSLVAYRLAYISIVSTISLALICWTTRTPYSHSLLSATVSVETLIAELLRELSISLGGTCIGYGVIAPVTAFRQDGMVNVLPPNFVQEAANRSTGILQSIVDFFTHHMITNFGVDYSMQGVNAKDLHSKLRSFFNQTTYEGPRYDTYLMYFSGPTNANGDWALTDNLQMDVSEVVSVWSECNKLSNSRLLLVCDTQHSHMWNPLVKRMDNACVALQTCKYTAKYNPASIGLFTTKWVDVNCGVSSMTSSEGSESFTCLYSVSPLWCHFDMHLPTTEETVQYWIDTLPRVTHCCVSTGIKVLSTGCPSMCDSCFRLLRTCRLRWFPPTHLDIGHGFKLISN